jgi:hypothetical protein
MSKARVEIYGLIFVLALNTLFAMPDQLKNPINSLIIERNEIKMKNRSMITTIILLNMFMRRSFQACKKIKMLNLVIKTMALYLLYLN